MMKMKILAQILIALMTFSCVSQKPISYSLPEKVVEKIKNYIELYRKNEPDARFFITLNKNDELFYTIHISEISDKSNEINSGLIKNGNRYILISNMQIPIVNAFDLNFINLGRTPRGGIIRRSVLNHDYGFHFTYDGEIIKGLK